jgi:hypothetical protein
VKLRARPDGSPNDSTLLFEPWERLMLVSIAINELEAPELRALADACFACIRHMSGRTTRADAYRAVKRALEAVRALTAPRREATPATAAPVQHRLPLEDSATTTVRISREAHDRVTRYARERGIDFESAVERLLRTAERRRASVNKWNRRAAATSEEPGA